MILAQKKQLESWYHIARVLTIFALFFSVGGLSFFKNTEGAIIFVVSRVAIFWPLYLIGTLELKNRLELLQNQKEIKERSKNWAAIIGFILGITAVLFGFGTIPSVLISAYGLTKHNLGKGGKWYAIAGLILSLSTLFIVGGILGKTLINTK
ncbi:MAG: hypothetical protein WAP74_04365 [Patescibacteria group bacterium]